MKHFVLVLGAALTSAVFSASAQIPISAGTYAQDFSSLGQASAQWTNNLTLTGWYASKGAGDATNFTAGTGSSSAGGMYSFGATGVGHITNRSLGTLAASSIAYAFGVRFLNNTAGTITNVVVSCVAKQWRTGSGATSPNTLAFTYQVGAGPITNTYAASGWTTFAGLNFVSPNLSGSGAAIDGNATTNQTVFSNIALAGVTVAPGQEILLRWRDVDDTGFDHGLAVDDLIVEFNASSNPSSAPVITLQPQNQSVTAGDNLAFTAAATGSPTPSFQWQWYGTNLPGQTGTSLSLADVTTNQAGPYRVVISNTAGVMNSDVATLTVTPAVAGFSLLTYNTHGNFVGDWTTNSAQVQAIGRQVQYLNPDIITFQEIPMTNSGWTHMGEFVAAFRPGYYLATNSGTDGFIRSAILSRYPITRSKSWLDSADLNPFGYTNSNFTRDLFEAQISVPGFPQPLHVFTTHLKSGQGTDDSNRRTAEAGCISNYFAMGFLTTNGLHPYVLTGDMNEDINDPPSSNPQTIQKLTSTPTGLRLTTPVNPFTSSRFTFSIQTSLNIRYDYVLPNSLLLSNIASAQVFRTDLLPTPPPPLLGTDSETASDHLPVLMVFNNPYAKPFKLLSVARSNQTVTLRWESVLGQPYRVESATNLIAWSVLANNLVATNSTFTYATNLSDPFRFFRIYRGP